MIKYKLLFFAIGLLGLASTATAQRRQIRVEGYVRDSTTQSPIPNVTIRINFAKSGYTTDEKGYYGFYVAEQVEHILTISHVGYRTFRTRFTRNQDYPLNVTLQSVAKELEEVIISSKSSEQNVNRPLLGVSSLNIKQLKKIPAFMGETDVLRGLQMLPGVTSVGEAANGVNIRGGTTDQNLILLDDAPIFNPTHLFGLFSVFPPDAVSSVELYKGGIPSRFGGRVASVLDVSMALPSLSKFKMQGGISPVSNRLNVEVPLIKNKMAISVAGRGFFNDFLFRLGPERIKNIRANFGDVATKLFYQVNTKNTLTLSGYWSKDFFQTDLLGTIDNINATSTQFDYRTLNGTLKWFYALSPKLNVQTVAVYSHYTPKTILPELNRNNSVTLASAITQQQFKSSVSYLPNTKHKIEAGLSAIRYRIEPGSLEPGTSLSVNRRRVLPENAWELALFADDEITVSPKLTLLLGLRYSHYLDVGPKTVRNYRPGEPKDGLSLVDSVQFNAGGVIQTYGGFEPRVSLKYSLDEATSLKFGYSLMRQYLQVISNTTTPLPTARWKTADTHVPPQVSHLVSGGYFRNLKDNIYEFSVEAYYRRTANILDFKPGADFLLQQFLETEILKGKNVSYGAEMMLAKKKGELTGWVSYTYARSLNQVNEGIGVGEQINNGNWYAANYDRPHSLNATVSINHDAIHTFSFNFAYSTGRPFTAPSGIVTYQGQAYPFYDKRNNDRIKDYHRLDFSWTIDNPDRRKDRRFKGSWTVTVYNIYGRKNPYSVFMRSVGSRNIQPYQLVIFGSPFGSLTYNFKF
jgi:hypothetical protein